ncbi:hypothetical protein M0813_03021 [Anaeramoeba flamelloides]|uniref:Uncharacterized protein n=1 Tax=Anaeramoeba flamelloides TaxID=1746091 RepID=A0ABQ8YF54_9EUKA|nr:hypothetical protein M0813_03021 [Anaeramoeba flamelloides]
MHLNSTNNSGERVPMCDLYLAHVLMLYAAVEAQSNLIKNFILGQTLLINPTFKLAHGSGLIRWINSNI